jgi:hypothetical protein
LGRYRDRSVAVFAHTRELREPDRTLRGGYQDADAPLPGDVVEDLPVSRPSLPGTRPHGRGHHRGLITEGAKGAMDALGLTQPTPVTFAVAREIIDADGHTEPSDPVHHTRVFVTPELDGWTWVNSGLEDARTFATSSEQDRNRRSSDGVGVRDPSICRGDPT